MKKYRVLFLCNANSARSLMAEALLNHIEGERIVAFSAGVEPDRPHELTLEALHHLGISTEGLASEPLESYAGEHFDSVIILCEKARQTCREWQGQADEVVFWDLPDPRLSDDSSAYRKTLREIRGRLQLWVDAKLRKLG
ncbi:arsenate reductase ArsC [Billgrantia pellis]|uniref:Arsenate reductase ArsC n=1 Tax=Billgrantia pellis TaxID=2606936 RepID=A0A7V7KHD9_9GAMM|nr:arsenate reductase ArsC [Halomonas pellis]KAA0011512.1 arsenate reductase ArsC [Halomonas pellis]